MIAVSEVDRNIETGVLDETTVPVPQPSGVLASVLSEIELSLEIDVSHE
jgi:hypothetical protein